MEVHFAAHILSFYSQTMIIKKILKLYQTQVLTLVALPEFVPFIYMEFFQLKLFAIWNIGLSGFGSNRHSIYF